ncbi:MAG: DUF3551 domain-containing protein [Bradyrhizobium sp.]|uniref:DUF3551 domain-containing protein n=1 Tax=Bradyrhizobium sp. TaxID=376 RepID=UPI001DEAD68B|nr:DUF3551 domain-containing protein [Bradyrhizobium sp.]MBV9564020.1 DUF3551 domain-containing protein [Bradyrhizobium sp.]
MRIPTLALLAGGALALAAPAQAQTYDPNYPVCLHVFSRGANYYQCTYTSLAQCHLSASGRAGTCDVNPYFQGGAFYDEPGPYVPHHRRRHYEPAY